LCTSLTLLERKNRNAIVHKIATENASTVTDEFKNIRNVYRKQFSQGFKTITSDNGSEFADL